MPCAVCRTPFLREFPEELNTQVAFAIAYGAAIPVSGVKCNRCGEVRCHTCAVHAQHPECSGAFEEF